MKTIKTRPTDKIPRELSGAARAPKEIMHKTLLAAKQQSQEVAERQSPQNDNPQQYAEDKVIEKVEDTAQQTGQSIKSGVQKVSNKIRETKNMSRGADKSSSFSSEQKRAYQQGKERVVKNTKTAKQTTQNVRNANNAARSAKNTANATKATAKGTVKTAQKSVKVANTTVKTSAKAIKTSAQAAKTAAKTAQATAKAAAKAVQAAKVAAKAMVTAAKVTVKAIIAGVKAAIAAIKALIAAIAAGGWVAIVIVIVVAVIALILGSAFGIFASNEPSEGAVPISDVIREINDEYTDKIDKAVENASVGYDEVNVTYDGGSDGVGYASNWADVLGVFAVKATMSEDNPTDVVQITPEKAELLRSVFYDMNSFKLTKVVSYRTETSVDDEGNVTQTTISIIDITVNIYSKDYDDMESDMPEQQVALLREIMQPTYFPLFSDLLMPSELGDDDWGVPNPDLPIDGSISARLMAAAKRYIGTSYSVLDCSGFTRRVYADCGIKTISGMVASAQAKKCVDMGRFFTDKSQLQPGDLIFYARPSSRGPEYCTDTNRCGTGKCKRYMRIHHVAMYVDSKTRIDSTGGKSSVHFRAVWGMGVFPPATGKWVIIGYGRPQI